MIGLAILVVAWMMYELYRAKSDLRVNLAFIVGLAAILWVIVSY